MIKERRGRIIVVAGSSASFIDNDSVDKRLSRLSAFTLSIHNKQGFLVASSSSLALSQEHANTKRCSVFLSATMYPIHLARSSLLSFVIYIFSIYNRRRWRKYWRNFDFLPPYSYRLIREADVQFFVRVQSHSLDSSQANGIDVLPAMSQRRFSCRMTRARHMDR